MDTIFQEALPIGCTLMNATHTVGGLILQASATPVTACCPCCHQESACPHGFCTRHPHDLSWGDQPVLLSLSVRRFRCGNPVCPRKTFTVPLIGLPRRAQRTERIQQAHAALGFSVGAEAASALSHLLHIPTSPDSLLRSIKRQPLPVHPTPRVLGVDDWAIRKGLSYGTLLVDLERHQVVDVLKGRSADALRDWLRGHPGVEIITRDRASEYSRAATDAAPQAQQIADRWHLLCNLSGVVRDWLLRERPVWLDIVTQVKARFSAPPATQEEAPGNPAPPVQQNAPKARRALYQDVLLLNQQGVNSKQIATQTGVAYGTVRWWLTKGEGGPDRRSPLTLEHQSHIERRWHDADCSAAELYRELVGQGYIGSVAPIRLMLYHLDLEQGVQERTVPARRRARRKDFNLTALTKLLVTPEPRLTEPDRAFVQELCAHSSLVQTGYALIQAFRCMFCSVGESNTERLSGWIEGAKAADIPELRNLAASLQRDVQAVSAALTTHWSNAQTEGQVTKLKLIKRRHYGRASFELLRRSVLLA